MKCDKYKCIFIHIPKTGGTSIEKVLYPDRDITCMKTDNDLIYGRFPKHINKTVPGITSHKFGYLQHLTYNQLIESKYIDDLEVNEYYFFTFVRNPWDREVSEFCWRSRNAKRREMFSITSFVQFVKRPRLSRPGTIGWQHDLPQVEYIKRASGPYVNFIGRFEKLQHDFNIICDKTGIPCHKLPHIYKSKRSTHYSQYYNNETRQIIENVYAEDIERFGYKFENVS